MRKTALAILALALALPLSAATWKNVSLMDANCATKKAAMENPDNHTRSCSIQCAKAGYGAVVDGKFVKFDSKGSDLAKEALQKSEKKDHLRATVNGEMKDGVIHVSSLTMD
jgi:Flp pilus assembly protein CpaB